MSDANETLGRYALLEPLARGGMAELLLARQRGPAGYTKTVVVKRILPHLEDDERFVELFLDEARLAAVLSHPNIVQALDFWEEEGRHYLVMEYLCGEDLSSIVRRVRETGGAVPHDVASLVCSHTLEGLHHAHTAKGDDGCPLNVVHMDVSPANVMVTYQGAVKLLDFGIATSTCSRGRPVTGALRGKYSYMSPEQARGEPTDARSDVFAFGSVFHELLTGVRLFQRDNQMASMLAIVEDPIPSPSERRPDLPPEIDRIVMKALERDPEKRFSSAREMREALDAFSADLMRGPADVVLRRYIEDLFGREHASDRLGVGQAVAVSQSAVSARGAPGRLGSDPAGTIPPAGVGRDERSSVGRSGSLAEKRPRKPKSRKVVGLAVAAAAVIAIVLLFSFAIGRGEAPEAAIANEGRPAASDRARAAEAPAPDPDHSTSMGRSSRAAEIPAAVEFKGEGAAIGAFGHLEGPATREGIDSASGKAKGILDVNCVPWCRIVIDELGEQETSPIRGLRLSAGRHRIRLVHPPTGAERIEDVLVEAGRETVAVFHF